MKFLHELQNPAVYPHPTGEIQLIETHISWVVLTGSYAYKLKKPVNFGFLDFSTLDKRRFYCEEEIRLNKRLAAAIYLQTVQFTGIDNQLQLNGDGPVLEYAVKMRQFEQADQFDRLLSNQQLHLPDITDLAKIIANFHRTVPQANVGSQFGDPEHIHTPVQENFSHIAALVESQQDIQILAEISQWSETEFEKMQTTILSRKQEGYVRECHGDMHLRNIAKYQAEIVIFDCIEFNDNLRWIDVISEIAFIEMDLIDRGRLDFANVLLNRYLEISGDYSAMRLLRFYLVYRAMVRAKVDCLRAHQSDISDTEKTATVKEYRHYMNLAKQFTTPSPPFLLITCGLSGCGKTYVTDKLMSYMSFIRLRSDIERKRLFGLTAEESSQSALDSGIYTKSASAQTYSSLAELASLILKSQWNVIVDAAFLRHSDRQRFKDIAAQLNITFAILHFNAPGDVLMKRVTQRQKQSSDASEADVNVLSKQLSTQEFLSAKEKHYTIEVDTSNSVDFPSLAHRIQNWLNNPR